MRLARAKRHKDNSTTSAPESPVVSQGLLEVLWRVLRVTAMHNCEHRSNMILARRNSGVPRPIFKSRMPKC